MRRAHASHRRPQFTTTALDAADGRLYNTAKHAKRWPMTTTVAQMTQDELREMIESLIEQKMVELLGDPDEGLEIREALRTRLLRQREAAAAGERGEPLEDVV